MSALSKLIDLLTTQNAYRSRWLTLAREEHARNRQRDQSRPKARKRQKWLAETIATQQSVYEWNNKRVTELRETHQLAEKTKRHWWNRKPIVVWDIKVFSGWKTDPPAELPAAN